MAGSSKTDRNDATVGAWAAFNSAFWLYMHTI